MSDVQWNGSITSAKACKNWKAMMQWQKHNQLNIVCPNNRLQVGRHAGQIRFKIHRTSEILRAAAKGNMEKDSIRTDQIRTQAGKNQPAKNIG